MRSGCYLSKTLKVKKKYEFKGREFNSRLLSHFALSFVWAANGQRK
jgi:hypothetical protein